MHDQAVDILAHGVKYLMQCHNVAGRTFVVQIGEPADYVVDTSRAAGFWGLPDHMPANRCVRSAVRRHTTVVQHPLVLRSLPRK